jgi:GlpG protein
MRMTDFTLLLHSPVSACIGIICLVAFIFPHNQKWFDPHGNPLSWIAPAIEHMGFFHLFFNVYWLVILGRFVEDYFIQYSSWPIATTSLFYVSVAAASNTAQYYASGPFFAGLSGVIFGMVGFLQIVAPQHVRTIISFFVGWFFICILLSATNIWPIANSAHFVGALTGGLIGYIVHPP